MFGTSSSASCRHLLVRLQWQKPCFDWDSRRGVQALRPAHPISTQTCKPAIHLQQLVHFQVVRVKSTIFTMRHEVSCEQHCQQLYQNCKFQARCQRTTRLRSAGCDLLSPRSSVGDFSSTTLIGSPYNFVASFLAGPA